MGWPLRMFQEEGYYFVTSRCFQGRLLLRPSAEVNEVVGGVLARAVQQSAGNVRLHAFTFASDHFTQRSQCWTTRRWWGGCATSWPMG
ncbi:hypothetical protein [Archangium violaceum]|uniref:hypothetical protein n=1 Tax=Archangium violaceum TaxID=83451 RepID=UPI001EF49F23|nr:hypothetical protein [Archangium violaceum]